MNEKAPQVEAEIYPVTPKWLAEIVGEYGVAGGREPNPESAMLWLQLIQGINRFVRESIDAALRTRGAVPSDVVTEDVTTRQRRAFTKGWDERGMAHKIKSGIETDDRMRALLDVFYPRAAAPQPPAALPGEQDARLPQGAEAVGDDGWPKLTAEAKTAGPTFGKGVSARLLVEACYRRAAMETERRTMTPDAMRDEERRRRALWDMVHGPLDAAIAAKGRTDGGEPA